MRRFLRIALLLVLAVLILPYLITPLYLVLNPISNPMLWRWVTGQRVVRAFVPIDARRGRASQ